MTAGEDTMTCLADQALVHLLAPLAPLLADPEVSEILVNAPNSVWVERNGRLAAASGVLPAAQLRAMARVLASLVRADALDREGALEGAWRDWRITLVLPPVARDHPCLAMRRHRRRAVPLTSWTSTCRTTAALTTTCRDAPASRAAMAGHASAGARGGSTAPAMTASGFLHALLQEALKGGANLLIAGGTGTGKTTLLAGLLEAIPAPHRIVCLEDSPELPAGGHHQVRLLATSGHTLRSLLRLALRLRPDRIVVGEVRGGEAFDLLQAMATGHAGCLATIHAADPMGALLRLEQLVLSSGLAWPLAAIRAQVALCIGMVVQLARTPDGRAISAIHRIGGLADGEYVIKPLEPDARMSSSHRTR